VVDPKRDPQCCKGAILKCNAEYYDNHDDLSGFSGVAVITRGPQYPMIKFMEGRPEPISDGPYTPNFVNWIGAGDCFGAWLTLGLANELNLHDAAKQAHAAGRVYVKFPHNRPPRPEEVEKELALL